MNLLEPLIQRLARAATRRGIGPNALTTTGLGVSLGAAIAYAGGGARWGGALVIAAAGLDAFDGRLARLGRRATPAGALYDAVGDRIGEAAWCTGIAWWLVGAVTPSRAPLVVLAALGALTAAGLASYVQARAAGLGLEAGPGVPAGAARVIAVGMPSVILGPGPGGEWLSWMLVVFAVVSAATAAQCLVAAVRAGAGRDRDPSAQRRVTLPGRAAPNRHMPRGEAPR